MQSNEKVQQAEKIAGNSWSIDARDIAASNSKKGFYEADSDNLEINIVETKGEYQEVEIVYGNKKKRKIIKKFLPENLANIIYSLLRPSAKVGAVNLGNLSRGLQDDRFILQEKFLRILAKINQVSEIKTAEKIWDSEERISTAEKAILVAVVNRLRPEGEKIDRVIVSQRSSEISDQNSFKKFIAQMLDLTRSSEKLAGVLFGDLIEKLSNEKKSQLFGCVRGVLSESENSNRDHQIKFLQKILNEVLGDKKTTERTSF